MSLVSSGSWNKKYCQITVHKESLKITTVKPDLCFLFTSMPCQKTTQLCFHCTSTICQFLVLQGLMKAKSDSAAISAKKDLLTYCTPVL